MKKLLFLALWSAIPSGGIIPVGSRVMRAKRGEELFAEDHRFVLGSRGERAVSHEPPPSRQ